MRVAWRVLLLAVVGCVTATVVAMVVTGTAGDAWPLSWLGFCVVGAVLVTRIPTNRVGWAMLGIGLALTLIVVGDILPIPDRATIVGQPIGIVGFVLIALFILWFPTGAVVSPRWRWLQHAIVALGAVTAVYYLLRPGPLPDRAGVNNPIGIDVLAGLRDGLVELAAGFALAALGVLALISLVVRWRVARSAERQQLKWILLAGIWFIVGFFVFGMLVDQGTVSDVGISATFVIAFNAMAIGVGVAVTRYRLYDIDRIVNRAVVYALVVGVLGLVFVVGAVWLPSLLPFEDNSLAVAASTLAVLLLFNPLRHRVQRFVDRRFYRSRYDAQQVADEFSVRLRDQVDPDAVAWEWVEVVQRTLQPAAVSVWVREEA